MEGFSYGIHVDFEGGGDGCYIHLNDSYIFIEL